MGAADSDNWATPEMVTRYVAEELWKCFPYPATRGKEIVWEFGTIEAIVDVAIHPSNCSDLSHQIAESKRLREPEATYQIQAQALKVVNDLANKRRAFLLMLLGLGNSPIPGNLSRDGALEEQAAQIYQVPASDFRRAFERARSSFKETQQEMAKASKQRLETIRSKGPITKAHPGPASKYPRIFDDLEKRLVEKRRNAKAGGSDSS